MDTLLHRQKRVMGGALVREVLSKLHGLRGSIAAFLPPDRRAQFFDPLETTEFFERYAPLRDALRAKHPELFGDLPVREIPHPSGTTDHEGRGYIVRKHVEQLLRDIDYILEVAAKGLEVEPPPIAVTREGIFFSGQHFDALRRITEILGAAQSSIVIVDGYVDEDVLNLLTTKDAKVEVRILTKDAPPALVIAARAFNKQYGRLSIHTSQAFHDRFVIMDDRDFYHFGASIKDAGSRGFMFSKIEESEVIDDLRKKVAEEWQRAAVVV